MGPETAPSSNSDSLLAATQAPEPQAPVAAPSRVSSMYGRENPAQLHGDELRAFAHRQGIARTYLARMDDAKIRLELGFILARQYEQRLAG